MTPSKPPAEASSRASAWEWAQVALLVSNLVWTTLCLGGFLAATLVVTSALGGAMLGVHFLERAFLGVRPRFHPAGWLLLPFLIYAAANVQWITPVPWRGWMDWCNWLHVAAIFWVVLNGVRSRRPQQMFFFTFVGLGCLLVVLACYQRFVAPEWLMLERTQAAQFIGRASGSFGSPNSFAAFLLLLLPTAGALALRRQTTATQRIFWGYLTVVFGFALGLTISRGAWLSLGLVLALYPLFGVGGSTLRRFIYVAGCWAALIALTLFTYRAVPAARERFELLRTQGGELSRPIMWRAAWAMFRERPLVGGGAGSYQVRFDQHRPASFQLEPRTAHNQYLDTLGEYGLIGFVLLVAPVGIMVVQGRRARERGRIAPRRGTISTGGLGLSLAAYALQLLVDSSFKLPALGMSFAALSALLVQRWWPVSEAAADPRGRDRPRVLAALVTLSIAGMTIWAVLPMYRAEGIREQAREKIDRMAPGRLAPDSTVLMTARDELRAATRVSPRNATAWADLSYATVALAQVDPAGAVGLASEAEAAADRALAISTHVAEFWIQRGLALDGQGRWVEAGAAFVEALKLAPTRGGVWYRHAAHLGLRQSAMEQALAAAEFSLRLDPGNPEAHALRQQLAERSHAR